MQNRRELLKRSALLSLAPTIPAFLRTAAATPLKSHERILVVIQLDGGNDGLNTVVPFKDDGYLANRRALQLPVGQLLKIDDSTGFHPNMQDMADLLQDNRLAVVQGVGYPNPSRSHDVSMAVWHTASPDREDHRGLGWLGKALDQLSSSHELPSSVLVADEEAQVALRGRKSLSVNMDSLKDFDAQFAVRQLPVSDVDSSVAAFMKRSALDAYATAQRVAQIAVSSGMEANENLSRLGSDLARRLKIIANLIQAEFGPRVYYCIQPGYDTHATQLRDHRELLSTLSSSLKAFLADIQSSGWGDQVLVMCFSEFGRQVKENASEGTDHGTAGPVFLAGNSVQAGLHGTPVDLGQLDGNAPEHTVDFRQVYATILERWLSIEPTAVLTHPPTPLNLLRHDG